MVNLTPMRTVCHSSQGGGHFTFFERQLQTIRGIAEPYPYAGGGTCSGGGQTLSSCTMVRCTCRSIPRLHCRTMCKHSSGYVASLVSSVTVWRPVATRLFEIGPSSCLSVRKVFRLTQARYKCLKRRWNGQLCLKTTPPKACGTNTVKDKQI